VSGDFTKPVQGKTQLIEELITHQQITFNGVTYEMGGNLFCATEMIDAVKLTVGQPLFIRTPYQNECIDETAWWPESDSVFRETLASELPELVGYLYNL
ncbi:MAG TPA: hypothetical protein VE912_20185, partial [Bacteroidales bacterium]|nr:hypothetical protein [Bacteroidales bacterium]